MRKIRYGAPDPSNSRIPSIEDFAWFDLYLHYLSACIVNVRSDDKALLAPIHSVLDGDNISRCDILIRSLRHDDKIVAIGIEGGDK